MLSLNKHYNLGELSYSQVDQNWDDLENEVNGLSSRLPLNNYAATTSPTVNDDVTQGYSNGSLWYNRTTDTAFVLTNASSGAANWVERDSISASDLGSAAFADILGTVSQSGGVPTGSLFERGSNANGQFIKFPDGTLICTRVVTVMGLEVTDSIGSVYRRVLLAGAYDFPSSFVTGGADYVSISMLGSGSSPIRNNVFSTRFYSGSAAQAVEWRNPAAYAAEPTSAGAEELTSFAFFAIGRWY